MFENVKKRITEEVIEYEGRRFKIKKYDPLIGNYILMKVFSMSLPFGLDEAISSKLGSLGSNRKDMSKEEFLDLEKDILSTCYEILPAGDAPIINSSGYGIIDFSMKIAIKLILSSIVFNFSDFFGGSLLNLDKKEEQEEQ